MKLLIVTHNDGQGGAALALRRIAAHLRRHGHEVQLLVARRTTDLPDVAELPGTRWKATARAYLARLLIFAATGSRAADRSLGLLASGLVAAINASDADVVMLGWLGEETLSIDEIAAIRKPLVWRFSDMWPLTGTEHYVDAEAFSRYGVAGRERLAEARDLDARVFRRKQAAWCRQIVAIAPSRWIADCIRGSGIAADWPVHQVPTPVDVEVFRPFPHAAIRAELGLPPDRRLLVFSALAADGDARKGGDLLFAALRLLDPAQTSCVMIGHAGACGEDDCPLPIIATGPIAEDALLAKYYAAADVLVLPSRLDNLPQVGLEAQACGTPVVAFDIGGMRDLVEDGVTGIRVPPFSVEGLAQAMRTLLADAELRERYARAARRRALDLWAPDVVMPRFVAAFEDARRRYVTAGPDA